MRRTLHYTPWEFSKDGGGKAETQYINNRNTYIHTVLPSVQIECCFPIF